MSLNRKLAFAFLTGMIILGVGTAEFHHFEGWTVLESLYTTVTTVLTVGYGDFAPRTTGGRIFTIFLIVFGVGLMLYTVGLFAESMFEVRLKVILGRGKMERAITKLHNHYIICGCGRIGHLIAKELAEEKVPFIILDNNPEILQMVEDEGFIYHKGDATEDKALIDAGVKRAKGLVCVLPTDAENLYVILSAKELNPDLYILSRSAEVTSEARLLRAGADRVISPYTLGGMRMAMAILRPAMLDFIEITTRRQSLELRMEELPISGGSPFIGKSLEQSGIRQKFGLIIVAVKKSSGKMIFNPAADYVIEQNDVMIAMGVDENVTKFSQACCA